MSEATFEKHLGDLKEVLNLLLGDIESGPDDVVQDWYNETLSAIYSYEDEVDTNLYVRLNLDEDAIEDGEILVDDEAAEDTETVENEDIEEMIDDGTEEIDETIADEEISDGTVEMEDMENIKTITININFPNS